VEVPAGTRMRQPLHWAANLLARARLPICKAHGLPCLPRPTGVYSRPAPGHASASYPRAHAWLPRAEARRARPGRTANCAASWSLTPSGTGSRFEAGAAMKLCQVPPPSALPRPVAL